VKLTFSTSLLTDKDNPIEGLMVTAFASATANDIPFLPTKRNDRNADRATLTCVAELPDEDVAKLSATITGGVSGFSGSSGVPAGYVRPTATREHVPPKQFVANQVDAVKLFAWDVCPPGTKTPTGTSTL
jgi:hypothetical protein